MKNGFSKSNALLLLATIAVCAVVLEWLLRAFVFDPNAAYIRTPGWAMQVRTNGLIPYVSDDHLYQVNRLGIRGDMPGMRAHPKIAVLGGSTVEDWVLPEHKTWVQQMGVQLRDCAPDLWVANLGRGGVNARHHVIQLPEVEKYMPRYDLFVVLLGLNDFLYDLRIHHALDTQDGWLQRQAFMSQPGAEGAFAVVALAKRLFRRFQNADGGKVPVSDFGHYQRYLIDAHAKVAKERWVETMPDLTPHLARYRETISALKAYADSYGVPIVFVTQPYVWSATMSEETKAQIYAGFIGSDLRSPNTNWYTTAALEAGLSKYNDTLIRACETGKLTCVDAARALPREAPYFYDDFHFSDLGAATLGKIVATAVRPHLVDCQKIR